MMIYSTLLYYYGYSTTMVYCISTEVRAGLLVWSVLCMSSCLCTIAELSVMGVSSAVQLAVQQLQYVTPRTDRHAYGFSFHLTRAVPLQPRYWSFLRISSSPAWSQHAQSQLHPGSRIPVTLTAVSHL